MKARDRAIKNSAIGPRIAGLLISLPLAACDGTSSFSNYSNYDLGQQYQACQKSNLSPGGAQRCSNIERECRRRKETTGYRC